VQLSAAVKRLESRFSSRYRRLPQTHADVLKHLWLPIPRSPVVKSCLHPTAQIGRPVSLNDASGLTILTVSPPGSVSIRQDFFWERAATVLSYHLAPIARASAAAAAHDRPDNMQRP